MDLSGDDRGFARLSERLAAQPATAEPRVMVATSAVEGTGIEELRQAILSALQTTLPDSDTVPLTNLRQHQAITTALAAVRSAEQGAAASVPHEMLLLDLHECLHALDTLTGTTHTDEILNLIFSTFCIGK